MQNIITFDSASKKKILDFFDKTVNGEGYIVEKNNQDQKVLTIEGEPLMHDDFAGLMKGSEIFIKSDIASLIKLTDKIG